MSVKIINFKPLKQQRDMQYTDSLPEIPITIFFFVNIFYTNPSL